MWKRLAVALSLGLIFPVVAWGSVSSGYNLSIDGEGFTGCGLLLQSVEGGSSGVLSSDDAGNLDVCTSNFVPSGEVSASTSASPGPFDVGVSARVDMIDSIHGVFARTGASFTDGIIVSVPGLESATPLKVDFDYVLSGDCSASDGFSCVGDYQIRVHSTTLQRVLVSQSGASTPTSGMTAQGLIFNGFEFLLSVSLSVTARGSAVSPPGGGFAQGNFSRGEITRMYVYDNDGTELDPSLYSVEFLSGSALPVPEPGAGLQGIACILTLAVCRRFASLDAVK